MWSGHYQYKYTIATYIYIIIYLRGNLSGSTSCVRMPRSTGMFVISIAIMWVYYFTSLDMSSTRPGHSIAFDHANEIFVGLFKRMIARGRPTDETMSRVSQNLTFLRDTWEGLTKACDIDGRHVKTKAKKAYEKELTSVINYFRAQEILVARDNRKMRDLVPEKVVSSLKLTKLHGNIINRVNTITLDKMNVL